MKLVVGTASTWSLRAWICSQLVNIDLDIVVIDLTAPDYKQKLLQHSPTGLVPALIVDDKVIHDSFAIAEYFNEISKGNLYPEPVFQRASARSLCAEMHSGFSHLRSQCPFTLLDNVAHVVINSDLTSELDRVEVIFASAQGNFMYEQASIVDAFYAILAYRLKSYGITFEGKAGNYQASLLAWPLLQRAIDVAKQWS